MTNNIKGLKINENYSNLADSYLFPMINKRVNDFLAENKDVNIIKLGIGDVTLPLAKTVVDEMSKASLEMGVKETFKGYGDEQGYGFLINSIKDYYETKNVLLNKGEIFISDGAKSDLGNILDIFSNENEVLIPDPVYPVYVDTNIMDGRKINYMYGTTENDFLPMPTDDLKGDIIYLCSPNNPTGAVYTKEQLQIWVDFANENDSVILFDSAYEVFISDETLPTSIYQIKGAETCAIEFCSFSKTAGFTGTRCGYTVVPKALKRQGVELNKLWLRRQTTKFNGVSYVVQKGAAAIFTENGIKEIKENIAYYLNNAKVISNALDEMGISYTGGTHSPYIWLKCPNDMTSWDFFDKLLYEANIVGTPGAGFGKMGEGFFRLTAFNSLENTVEAMSRLKKLNM